MSAMAENGFLVGFVKRGKMSSDITHHVNVSNAKLLAILLVVCLSGYQAALKVYEGVDSCGWLLSRGSYRGHDTWQPHGCMLHRYSSRDLERCYEGTGFLDKEHNHWVFVGDSRIRQLYFEVLKGINAKAEPSIIKKDTAPNYYEFVESEFSISNKVEAEGEDARPLEKAHKSLTYSVTDLSLRITFFWRPVFNSSVVELVNQLKRATSLPKLIVAGSGAWDIKLSNGSEMGLAEYGENLAKVVECLDQWPDNSTTILWKFQDPVDGTKLSESRQMITNEVIDQYNYVAEQVLRGSRFHAWHSARLSTENVATDEDGLHIGQVPLKYQAQMLFNAYCNPWIEVQDGTCCRSSEPITPLQILTFTVLLTCSSTSALLVICRHVRRARQPRVTFKQSVKAEESTEPLVPADAAAAKQPTPTDVEKAAAAAKPILASKDEPGWRVAVTALGNLGLIMAYFYVCDRTTFFMKENKHYTHVSFWLPVFYVFTLGLFFNEESRSTRVLHRDQTDEWKGWMQLVILIYHMTGASQVLPLYMQMRILVSSYLFLTGYGHLCFFWNGGSASLVRLFQVLFRMNLMTVVICFCMNRPYQSYYFVPLVSFWYLVVYIVLAVPPKVSSAICDAKPVAYLYIVVKFVALFAGIALLHLSQVFFESVFLLRPWKGLFVTRDDSIHEWWFRWSLDRYSICYGMVFGFVYLNAQKHGVIDDSTRQNLLNKGRAAVPLVAGALLAFAGYTAFTLTCRNKPECNAVHSYAAFVPIVSFVVLRNALGPIRVRYSSFFAWFGRISLELFIGQYHIWLAADTHGVLVLVPGYPALNVAVTTFVLVCAAHEVHAVTGQLASLAVPADWKRTLRNVVLFFLALVPIAIHRGDL